ncbi:MAG: GntR family transcriptional regulator [Oceanospirillaceae bacterium]|nr:GntR family transcriptional regulator [Oceanospirillaceae bacterium]
MSKMDQKDLLGLILKTMQSETAANPKETKKSVLRFALLETMKNGLLKPGDRLPSEQEMSKALDLSTGTIQGTLRQLQDLGVIIRRRGDGTVVADKEPLAESIWHFRFVHKGSGKPLRPQPSIIDISETEEQGLWTRYLGPPPYIRIIRDISGDGLQLGAVMYLSSRLINISRLRREELDGVNLRVALESELGERAQKDRTTIFHAKLDYQLAEQFGMIPGSDTLVIRAATRLSNGTPFYFQEIFAPADPLELEV